MLTHPAAFRPSTRAALAAAAASVVEPLEGRRLMAADTFAGSGAWTDVSHWSLHAVRGSGDTATVAAGATATVAAAEPAAGVTNLGTIDLTTDGATFDVSYYQTVTNSGTIAKTGGSGTSVLVPGAAGGTVVDNGGTLAAAVGTPSIQSRATLNGTHLAPAAGAAVAFDQYSAASPGGFSNSTSVSGVVTGTGAGSVLFRSGAMYNLHQAAGDAIPTGTLNLPAGMAQVTGFGFETYGDDAQVVNAGGWTTSARPPTPTSTSTTPARS